MFFSLHYIRCAWCNRNQAKGVCLFIHDIHLTYLSRLMSLLTMAAAASALCAWRPVLMCTKPWWSSTSWVRSPSPSRSCLTWRSEELGALWLWAAWLASLGRPWQQDTLPANMLCRWGGWRIHVIWFTSLIQSVFCVWFVHWVSTELHLDFFMSLHMKHLVCALSLSSRCYTNIV